MTASVEVARRAEASGTEISRARPAAAVAVANRFATVRALIAAPVTIRSRPGLQWQQISPR